MWNGFFHLKTDCMITNMNIKLEDIIEKYANQDTHFMVPADCNGTNCGNMLIKNSETGRSFINTINRWDYQFIDTGIYLKINSFRIYS